MTHFAYKRFVDEMVKVSGNSVAASRIRAHGHPVRTNESDSELSRDEFDLRDVFSRLSADQREVLARAFERERSSGLHDFASFLEWTTSCDDMTIQWGAETFGSSPFNTMHGDFLGRVNGDEWEN